jgi:hypothetical protein
LSFDCNRQDPAQCKNMRLNAGIVARF